MYICNLQYCKIKHDECVVLNESDTNMSSQLSSLVTFRRFLLHLEFVCSHINADIVNESAEVTVLCDAIRAQIEHLNTAILRRRSLKTGEDSDVELEGEEEEEEEEDECNASPRSSLFKEWTKKNKQRVITKAPSSK